MKQVREAEMNHSSYIENPELNCPLSYDEVKNLVNKLKLNKSSGIDQIPNEVLKHSDVMLMLCYMFTKCFDYRLVPSICFKAVITPIPKSSNKDLYVTLNYRGISILSFVSKVFTGIINAHVMNYCELRDLPFDEQCGFRKNRSRVDQLYTLTSLVRNRRSENKGTYACFIDWVDMFFYKLQEYNIDGKVYNCIKELYNHPLSNVKLNNYVTDWFSTESGVRQGDSLSPTLFAICINDLAKELKELDIPISIPFAKNKIPFADDIVILAENKSQLQKY